ncbi:MAG: putative 2-aminoethylphosphonate ABC transporter ATP-binding protein [Burkholderiales bacterium]
MTATSAQAAALELKGIGKHFGAFEVLRGVDLSVRNGEFVCFLGPSGCGKSTLLRVIAGLVAQSSGQVWKAGRDISGLDPASRDVGILFQSYALFPNLDVFDNVAYGLVTRRGKRADIQSRVSELLALVGLPGTERKLPAQLSGGQQQRVALARALAPSPGLLLLDEPLSALDAKVRVHLRQQIRDLQRRLGVTTIMVTHDQEEALTMADRVVVMNGGGLEQVGTPSEIYNHPATRFVANFVGKMNFVPAVLLEQSTVRAGQVTLQLSSRPDVAGPLLVAFRPEEVAIASEGTANAWEAQIASLEFLGSSWRATLACPALSADPLLADFSTRDMRDLELRAGQRLAIAVAPQHLHVFGDAAALA